MKIREDMFNDIEQQAEELPPQIKLNISNALAEMKEIDKRPENRARVDIQCSIIRTLIKYCICRKY